MPGSLLVAQTQTLSRWTLDRSTRLTLEASILSSRSALSLWPDLRRWPGWCYAPPPRPTEHTCYAPLARHTASVTLPLPLPPDPLQLEVSAVVLPVVDLLQGAAGLPLLPAGPGMRPWCVRRRGRSWDRGLHGAAAAAGGAAGASWRSKSRSAAGLLGHRHFHQSLPARPSHTPHHFP